MSNVLLCQLQKPGSLWLGFVKLILFLGMNLARVLQKWSEGTGIVGKD